jgi:hypothetical protein
MRHRHTTHRKPYRAYRAICQPSLAQLQQDAQAKTYMFGLTVLLASVFGRNAQPGSLECDIWRNALESTSKDFLASSGRAVAADFVCD